MVVLVAAVERVLALLVEQEIRHQLRLRRATTAVRLIPAQPLAQVMVAAVAAQVALACQEILPETAAQRPLQALAEHQPIMPVVAAAVDLRPQPQVG